MTRNGESKSIASPTIISLFFSVLGFDLKSPMTWKFLQRKHVQKRKPSLKLEYYDYHYHT
jgi:hypothetical protein